MPLSAAVASRKVFEAFWSDDAGAALMHGPTYMGNPLACAAAAASLDLFERGDWRGQVEKLAQALREGLEPCRALPGVRDVRVLGAMGVVEMDRPVDAALSDRFVAEGVWIRPFGRIVYLTPAFVITDEDLKALVGAIRKVLAG